MHYKVASGHREKFSTFFKPLQLLPPDCLPESPVSIASQSVNLDTALHCKKK